MLRLDYLIFFDQYILVELGATFSLILVLVRKLESKASIFSRALSICERQNWTLMIVSCAHGRDTRGPPSGCSAVYLPSVPLPTYLLDLVSGEDVNFPVTEE